MTESVTPEQLYKYVRPVLSKLAFFLDYDGTTIPVPTTEQPEKQLSSTVLKNIVSIRESLGGAVAFVTGRDISGIDENTPGHTFAVAGNQGRSQRYLYPTERLEKRDMPDVSAALRLVEAVVKKHKGMKLFRKAGGAFGVEYYKVADGKRTSAKRELDMALATLRSRSDVIVYEFDGARDVTDTDNTKAKAIERFMREKPFKGRIPFVAGNEQNDEDGFVYVNKIAVQGYKFSNFVGSGSTGARFKLKSVRDFREFLGMVEEGLRGSRGSAGGGSSGGGSGGGKASKSAMSAVLGDGAGVNAGTASKSISSTAATYCSSHWMQRVIAGNTGGSRRTSSSQKCPMCGN
jgi:trehalose 6-phosphate phosphatase